MRKISSFIFAASALILAASCAKEINVVDPTPENGKEISITVIASEKPEVEAETKTFIDGTSVKWSASGEKLKVFEVATPAEGDLVTTQATSADGVTSDGGATMSFGVSLADKSEGYTSFDYYAVYPSSAYQSHSSVNAVFINTKGSQTPSATNFDASQDLLIAKRIEGESSQAKTLEMQFARVVAIGKMTIKNLESTDPITKITFSAKVGGEPVALAGRTNFNLETAKPVSAYASNTQDYAIVLDYEGQNITANTSAGMVAYFTCYPFAINAETPGSFKVVVETATQSFTKEVNVSSIKGLAFNIGKGSVFSVNMAGITGETKAIDLRYAYLDYEDFSTNGGSNSYGNVTVDKTHGDSWVMYAAATNNAIGVRRNDKTDNDSYIKLPDFKEDIKSVVVTLKNVTASQSITLETSATAKSGTIASLATTEATVYTFDLSSESVKTAYFRSSGFQALVEKIEVYAGTDNRTKLSAPTSVNAAVNTESTNSIDVSWGEVSGAGSYIVTLKSDGNDDVVVETELLSITVANLENSTDYRVGVQAIPADAYVNTTSEVAYYSDIVTTGIGSIDYSKVETSNVTLSAGTNGSAATVNNQTAIKVGTSSKGGDMSVTVPAGTTTLHVHAAAWNGVNGLSLNISGATSSPTSISLTADSGISGNSPFTLNGNPEDFYFEIALSNITTVTTIKFTSSSAKRFAVWGVNAEQVVDDRTAVSLEFAEDAYEFVVNSTEYNAFVPQTATATPNIAAINSAITYAVTDPNGVVSGFNTSTGSFSLTGEIGTATITASYAGDENYKPAEDVNYTVRVKNAGGGTATFTFGDNISSTSGTINGVTLSSANSNTVNASTGNTPAYNSTSSELRIYRYGSFTLSSESTITGVTITFTDGYLGSDTNTNVGTYSVSGTTGTWSGSSNSVTFNNVGTANVQMRIKAIEVTYN